MRQSIIIPATLSMLVLALSFAGAQPLASGQWSKFSVGADGVYRIDYATLKKAGFNPDQIDPRLLQVFSNGNGMLPQANSAARQNQLMELAVLVQGEEDGKFDKGDYLLFFGQGADEFHFDVPSNSFKYTRNLYSDRNYYFLTVGLQPGKRMTISENKSGQFPAVTEFNDFAWYENDQYNILKSGRVWYGEQFNTSTSITIQFAIPGIVSGSSIHIVSSVMARAFDDVSTFRVFFNDVQVVEHAVPVIIDSPYTTKGADDVDSATVVAEGVGAVDQSKQNIRYEYIKAPTGYSVGYLNNFLISLTRKLAWYNGQTAFTSASSLAQPVSTFTVDGLPPTAGIWDITNPFDVRIQSFTKASSSSFSTETSALKRFISYVPESAAAPVFESAVANQNLSLLTAPDLLIITHPDFKAQALRLAGFRQSHDHLTVLTITPQEIYNEYSGGKQDITALRDFVRDLSSRTGTGLDNLLLFGRCSYDYKNRIAENTNFVPTYESRNSLDPIETYSSDDYFSFLESGEGEWPEDPAVNYTMDIGVGRISVVTAAQATSVVDKLIDYANEKEFGSWRNKIVFVADDGDYNLHQSSADDLAVSVETAHPEIITEKLYLDQFKQIQKPSGQKSPDAKAALDRSIDHGTLIVNFTGHGSEHLWMQEEVLDDDLVEGLRNSRYPLFLTATCEFGRHDDPFQLSNAEQLLLMPGAGAIGMVTTARPVQAVTNSYLNTSFYQQLFVKAGGHYRNLGTIFRDTKNNSLSGVSNRNFSLLGDPSLQLALPSDEVVLTEIKTQSGSDTLKALSTVVIKGEIQTGGTRNAAFNGDVALTVFDRPVGFITKGDENPPFAYNQWSSAVFRGSVAALAGSFEATFILPNDIADDVGKGKISVYANSSSVDASGSSPVSIGGLEADAPPDNKGPAITLFMGDTTFVNGGIASPNTTLVVQLEDDSGIASSSFGGNNNLIAVLDDSLSYTMNDYYNASKNTYRRGLILYPLSSLAKGRHSIVTQASDTYGNRSSARIDFIVTDGNLVISSFYNYPNPFFPSATSVTHVGFTHNRPGEDLDVEFTIVDLAGRVVDFRHYNVPLSYTDVSLMEWDGTTAGGNKLGSGVYLGKLSVRSLLDGSKNQLFTKLIIGN